MQPADHEIERVMRDFPGIGRLQAIRHIQSRRMASDALARRRRAAIAEAVRPSDRLIVIDEAGDITVEQVDAFRSFGQISRAVVADIERKMKS